MTQASICHGLNVSIWSRSESRHWKYTGIKQDSREVLATWGMKLILIIRNEFLCSCRSFLWDYYSIYLGSIHLRCWRKFISPFSIRTESWSRDQINFHSLLLAVIIIFKTTFRRDAKTRLINNARTFLGKRFEYKR